jgi:hypothetical protein
MSKSLSSRQYAIIGLTVITAIIHLILGIRFLPDFLGILFILNGIGYLVLLIGLYFIPKLAPQRNLIHWLLLAFTALTFVLYFVFNWPDVWGLMGLVDKGIELLLIILLLLDRSN